MPDVPAQKLLRRQVKLFESDHKAPAELKSLGFALKREGLDVTRAYCNPAFLRLPWRECEHLAALTPEQLSVLTSRYFAGFYAHTATSETYALVHNNRVSESVFVPFSDEYMVLFHETDEEFDHIICFRAVAEGLTGRTDLVGSYYRLIGNVGERYEKRLCKEGFGAFFLLYRYILNIALKQTESFMHQDAPSLHPTAEAITTGHAHDEARHVTTSIELGLELLRAATDSSRREVREIIAVLLHAMIQGRFAESVFERKNADFELAMEALRMAKDHPSFADFPDPDALAGQWRERGLHVEPEEVQRRSKRWLASQIERLIARAELPPVARDSAAERYESFLNH